MKKSWKYILAGAVVVAAGAGIWGMRQLQKPADTDKISVIATSFPSFDLARAVIGNNTNVSLRMLLKPGSESHSYEPTPQDIIDIKKSRLFIYNGGDSDDWVKKVLQEIDEKQTKVVKLTDLVATKTEEVVEGMEEHEHHHGHEHEEGEHHEHKDDEHHKHEHHDEDHNEHRHEHNDEHHHEHHDEAQEIDEHVWTSPVKAAEIVKKLKGELARINPKEQANFTENAQKYTKQLATLSANFRQVVKSAKRKTIVVADRFPFRYFADEYGLKYHAAFPGCSEQTEASAKTLAFLTEKVKNEKIPVIFKIELSNGKIAENIAKETGVKVLELHSAHNITAADFESGKTYLDILKANLAALKKALN